MILKIFLN